jgi:hypothetical protein
MAVPLKISSISSRRLHSGVYENGAGASLPQGSGQCREPSGWSYNISTMPTSAKRHPLTSEQTAQLRDDLALIEERLQAIVILMRACYGEQSQAAIRAEETSGALQRLKWELERVQQKTQAAGG